VDRRKIEGKEKKSLKFVKKAHQAKVYGEESVVVDYSGPDGAQV